MTASLGISPLPCPWCGQVPTVFPSDPKKEGNAWAAVVCVNMDCPTMGRQGGVQVRDGEDSCDDRGSDAYKEAAIRRWNTRATSDQGLPELLAEVERLRGKNAELQRMTRWQPIETAPDFYALDDDRHADIKAPASKFGPMVILSDARGRERYWLKLPARPADLKGTPRDGR